MTGSLADADDGRGRELAGGVEAGVVEAGDDMGVRPLGLGAADSP